MASARHLLNHQSPTEASQTDARKKKKKRKKKKRKNVLTRRRCNKKSPLKTSAYPAPLSSGSTASSAARPCRSGLSGSATSNGFTAACKCLRAVSPVRHTTPDCFHNNSITKTCTAPETNEQQYRGSIVNTLNIDPDFKTTHTRSSNNQTNCTANQQHTRRTKKTEKVSPRKDKKKKKA